MQRNETEQKNKILEGQNGWKIKWDELDGIPMLKVKFHDE